MQKLSGVKLKVVWAKFSTLSLAVFVMSVIMWHSQARPHLELKTWHRFCLLRLSQPKLSGFNYIIRKDCFQVKSNLLTDFRFTIHMNIMILN